MHLRHEYKHRINHADLLELKTRLGALFPKDAHAAADGTYIVKSLYFDNYQDKALREKVTGVNRREKFRIRYYNTDTSFIRLEKKSKINGLSQKLSERITAEECQKILDGDIAFLSDSDRPLLRELYAKMHYQLLRPRTIVRYVRTSYVFPPGNVRITLDEEICGSTFVSAFLNPELPFSHLFHNAVLEVKWDRFLPQIVRDAVQVKNRRSASFSKYAAVRI